MANGQPEPTPNSTTTASATTTLSPTETPAPAGIPRPMPLGMTLNTSADPSVLTINTSTPVTFTVTTAGVPVNNATVTLGGVYNASGMTNSAGSTVIIVNATSAGKISAVASKEGFSIGTTTLTVTGGPSPLSDLFIIIIIVGELVLFGLTDCRKFECPKPNGSGQDTQNKLSRELSIIRLLSILSIFFTILLIVRWLAPGIWGELSKEIQEILTLVLIALGAVILIGIIYGLLTKKSWNWNLYWNLNWFNVTPSMFVSFSVVWISSAVWLLGTMENNFLIATLGAGVLGGIIYDIVVSKGEVILPKVDPDGISLGALYGGALGFASAIMVINSVYQTPSPIVNFNHSLLAFLSALGLKGFSEFSATTQLMTKKKASIEFNLDPPTNTCKATTENNNKAKVKVKGQIVINENVIESQTVHLNFQKDNNIQISVDVHTNDGTTFDNGEGIDLEVGNWQAWASWDGSDTYDKAESMHKKFEVKSE